MSLPRCLSVRAGALALFVAAAGVAAAETVKDPESGVTFWAPDGWTALTEAKPQFLSLRRVSPDGKALAGCLVGKVPGDVEAALLAMEAYWREGPETFERTTKADATVAGAAGIRAEYRIDAGGRALRAVALVGAKGDLRVALWAAFEQGLDASYGPIRQRILDSLVVPGAASPKPGVPAAPAPGSGLMFEPAFREGRPVDLLGAGDPALRRGDVDAFVDLSEEAYDLAFSAQEEQALRDGIESAWPKWKADVREGMLRAAATKAAAVAALGKGDAKAASAALSAFAAEWTTRAEAAPQARWHEPLKAAKARRASAFSAGEPAVSVASMDAFEELVSFVLSLARNDASAVTAGQRQAVRADVKKAVDASGPAVRRHYARVHRLWRLVKARWDAADETQRLRLRWAAVATVRRLERLSPFVPAHAEDEGLKGYARAAAETAGAMSLFEAYTTAFANPELLLSTAVEGAGLDPKDLEKAFAADVLPVR